MGIDEDTEVRAIFVRQVESLRSRVSTNQPNSIKGITVVE
jgi:hypothetical protein